MTYKAIASIQANNSLRARMIACAAEQHAEQPYLVWVDSNSWDLAAQPGWSDAWLYAQTTHSNDPMAYDPGDDEAVITDAMILSAVQHLMEPAQTT